MESDYGYTTIEQLLGIEPMKIKIKKEDVELCDSCYLDDHQFGWYDLKSMTKKQIEDHINGCEECNAFNMSFTDGDFEEDMLEVV